MSASRTWRTEPRPAARPRAGAGDAALRAALLVAAVAAAEFEVEGPLASRGPRSLARAGGGRGRDGGAGAARPGSSSCARRPR